jgi:hypothetical protein
MRREVQFGRSSVTPSGPSCIPSTPRSPGARMTAGHSHNEVFPFRAFAEYSIGEQVVDLTFDVQVKGSGIHALGDIARENGLILKDLMQALAESDSCEELLIAHAREFALRSPRNLDLIAKNRGQDRPS